MHSVLAMRSRLIVRADSSAMRQVDGFVATFVRDNEIGQDEASRILVLLEELITNLESMDIQIDRNPGTPRSYLR